jgi:hypothetical protein
MEVSSSDEEEEEEQESSEAPSSSATPPPRVLPSRATRGLRMVSALVWVAWPPRWSPQQETGGGEGGGRVALNPPPRDPTGKTSQPPLPGRRGRRLR